MSTSSSGSAGSRLLPALALFGLLAAGIVAGLVAGSGGTTAEPESWDTPVPKGPAKNVVLIIVDTLRAQSLDTYGYERPTSPNMTRFFEHGVVFERAYTHAPWTKPSIATILTGRAPRDHGITQWEAVLDAKHVTLAEHTKDHGFETTAYVSHHALDPKTSHFQQGFDVFDISIVKKGDPHKVISSADITDLGIAYLQDAPDEPFFLMLHYFDPHSYYQQHPDFVFGDTPLDKYDSEIAFFDHHLGRLFDALVAGGHMQDTVVALVSDHGDEFEEHGGKEHTTQLWNEVIGVPFMMRGPGIAPNQRVAGPVGLVDLTPTLAELAGLPQSPSFKGEPLPRDGMRFVDPERTVVSETRRIQNRRAIVRGQWKLYVDLRTNEMQLFDVVADPREKNDVAADHPEVVESLTTALNDYYAAGTETATVIELSQDAKDALKQLGYLSDDEDEPTDPGEAVGLEWVRIEGGRFKPTKLNGKPKSGREWDLPDYEILKTELTYAQYQACVRDGACVMPPATCAVDETPDHPMLCVSYAEARFACKYFGGSLPNLAEWEFAATSRGTTLYPWGDEEPTCETVSGLTGTDCADTAHAVCSKPGGNTAQGLCDMVGNALEWTQEPEPEKTRQRRRALRGGGVQVDAPLNTGARFFRRDDFGRDGAGVRCVRPVQAD
jgi:arylsulfatase A-like enzyme